MNIELPKLTSPRGIDGAMEIHEANGPKQTTEALRPLFGEALKIEEKSTLSLDALSGIDLSELEKALDREDALGRLASSHLTWEPPEMPDFV